MLKVVGQHLGDTVRGVDAVGRWGGEEFIVLVPETGATEARQLAERIRGEVARLSFRSAEDLRVTASLGVAHARNGESLENLTGRADAAMYRAKRAGRDQVVVAD